MTMNIRNKSLEPYQLDQISNMLIHGESPHKIAESLGISITRVFRVLQDEGFSIQCLEIFKTQAKGVALLAHNNLIRIAFDANASPATQLKASKILVDIARELEELHPSDLDPAHMSQDQLIDRLKSLQKEAIARAKPIDTGVIEHNPSTSLDDMLD